MDCKPLNVREGEQCSCASCQKTSVDAINVRGNNRMNYEHLKGTGDAITEDILGLSMPQEFLFDHIYEFNLFKFSDFNFEVSFPFQVRTNVCQNWPYE